MKKSKNIFNEELLMNKFKKYEQNKSILVRNEIVEMNVPLVKYVVTKYLSDIQVNADELISIGYFGLINAVETYDVDYGSKFNTYATICILNHIKNNLSTVTDIKMVRYNYPVLKAKGKIERTMGIKLDDNILELDSILEEDTFTNDEIKEKLKLYLLNRDCTYNEQNVTETYEIEDSVDTKIMIKKLNDCLSKLSEKERKVLEYKYGFYGICPTGNDLGNYLGCTRQNVDLIEKRALKKLRKKINYIR